MGAVIQSTIILYLTSFFIPKGIKIMNRLESFYSRSIEGQKFIQKKLFQQALEKSDNVITISNEMEENIKENINTSEGQIKTIYNPIDLDHIKKAAQEKANNDLPRGGPIIISCGRLAKPKGFEYLIKAFQRVKNNYSDAQLLILGQGELKDSLQELARALDIKDSVHFLGFKENPFKYIARADIFVLSSLWEGLPTALIEAMACGTPVVSTDCPSGPKEILENGKHGKLVKTENVGSLADGIVDLLKDKDLQEKYKEAGRRRAQDFSVDKIIKEYEEFLN
jgi:glycosyltransferase involved in cell wall biosynthesis